jgi:hypothetical protein
MAFDSFNPNDSLIPNDGDLVFDLMTGEGGPSPAETVLPYIEQRADPDTIYRDASVVTTLDHADFTLGSPEENDSSSQGIIIDWTPGDGWNGETVGVIAIISPTENDGSSQGNTWAGHTAQDGASQGIIVNWATSGPGDELTAGFCATGHEDAHIGDGGFVVIGGIVINWTPGDGSGHEAFPTATIQPTDLHLQGYDLVI